MSDNRRRVLKVGARRYLWKAYHQHLDGCEEVLRMREFGSVAGLTLVFRPGGERQVADGYPSASGDIWIGERSLNLNEPGVVRAFLDAAVDAGWMAHTRTMGRRDGWELFDIAHTRHTGWASRDLR
ncbi:hypothetical protein GV794_06325 [Nocardia cyriacigeorgica]|uniref:Uncharacterized protein n=1 Tax=Nocardia cyriacigeorgica TaxID=135487 RepID=A0A6P1D9G2_9NOCA|nr:hypothetical protein [Nocardia cyriacigeorgica]NEW40992.1 hypothetical protein [Nocardia cyriacigeorgica]NEW47335.1 hypothetical protein [Nocardia cyriacigeorgica]NEW51203.1 hypothetical protein [Nocardia cyriacigeorgica]NEW55273.1 hypothetical protein [Nocardia cyriacigeorgica]